jgi:choline transport protein
MSEEIHNPAKNIPRAMLFTILLNGSFGFAMLVALLFCLGDPGLAHATQFPFMGIFVQAVGNVSGALTMIALITVLCVCATISTIATSSRMTWAFARDRGTPGWKILSRVRCAVSSLTLPYLHHLSD